ncbi:DnaJ domain-containing protein [Natrinema sp. 1APR25-10V2]|uniref:J domain-containing protein n=1 Tax=Natrinema sp. 1APR25-10V2 TaxID=2951081 RepID=UPI00287497F0|nr:DnaJ domain-containing protein [Natrinema sp. 1APR25-10V2]MDS0477734.1 DnaJ domain-containing protein [Natrinema sp. 1APR25-10V2]
MTEDFYDLLEIPSDASQDEIKDAYREQVRVYHPDLNDDDRAQAQFTAVKTAYDILGDPVERQAYDRLGHEEYVAKRTSGLPSPDVWKSDDDEDDSSGTELSYSESETASASASTAGGAATGSTTSSRSAAGTGSSGASAGGAAAAGTAAGGSSAGAATGTGPAGGSGSGTAGRTGGSAPGAGTSSGAGTRSRSRTESGTDNALVRWWRRQNFSLPLIWLSVLVYAAGVGHFAFANRDALGSLWADLRATGADPAGLWRLLSESRHGIETTTAFVSGVEFVSPPLEQPLWYAALAGVVALALGALLVTRVRRRENTWGAVTINETIVVALALGVATTLAGGPLLAGTVLMPFLFGVIVRHTRRLPGWKPSYLYVMPVLAPIAGFGAAAAGIASLPVDFAAFALLPLIGGLALPLRTTIRKHLGR